MRGKENARDPACWQFKISIWMSVGSKLGVVVTSWLVRSSPD